MNQNKQQLTPDSPGVHSDVVSLGSRVGPALLPAHSSASEPAAPTLTRNTNCVLSNTNIFDYFARAHILLHCSNLIANSHVGCRLFVSLLVQITSCQPAHLSSTPVAESLLCKAATALDVFLPLQER